MRVGVKVEKGKCNFCYRSDEMERLRIRHQKTQGVPGLREG